MDMGAQKFCIRLLVAAADGMSEVQLRCRDVSGGGGGLGTPPLHPQGSERPLLGEMGRGGGPCDLIWVWKGELE